MDRIGNIIKRIESPKATRTTIFTTFNYAFRCRFSNDFNYIPPPTLSSYYNSYVRFGGKEPGEATVDWGDGNIETFPLIYNGTDYILSFRSLDIEYRKDPNNMAAWNFGKNVETGEYIIPYPNHHYADDDINKERSIVITFTCNITGATFSSTVHTQFPILEMESLTQLTMTENRDIKEIPYNRISKLKKLTYLHFERLGPVLQYIPDSIFNLSELSTLILTGVFNLSNIDSSNIRKISNLKKLGTLYLQNNYLQQYIKEFNDMPKLYKLDIVPNIQPDVYPKFDEITQINQSLTYFNYMGGGWINNRTRTNWCEQVSGKGIGNLTVLEINYAPKLTWDFPDYIRDEMRSLKTLNAISCNATQERADTFVNNFYDYVTGWTNITMNTTAKDNQRNQFYSLHVSIYTASEPTNNIRPSGIEQAPTGFVKGSSNGNPTTPMEKIYVLKNNYGQTWNIRPADS